MKYILALFFVSSILFAQSDSTYRFILPEVKISVVGYDKTDTYLFGKETNEFYLGKDKLTADTSRYKWNYNIKDVKSLQFRNGVATWGGALYGGIITGSITLAYGILNALWFKPKPAEIVLVLPGFAAAGFVAGAFIGGILGSFIPHYDTYGNFSSDLTAKKEQLRKILYKNDLNRNK